MAGYGVNCGGIKYLRNKLLNHEVFVLQIFEEQIFDCSGSGQVVYVLIMNNRYTEVLHL